MTGEASCQGDGDCRLVPVGSKPCGGPRAYAVFSTTVSDSLRVQAWAESLRIEERNRNLREGRNSDCALVTPPTPRCRAGRCVAEAQEAAP